MALVQILLHIREDGTILLEHLAALTQLLETGIGHTDQVASTNCIIRNIQPKNREVSQNFAECQVIAANDDWNPAP
jgi:hypothetical protein